MDVGYVGLGAMGGALAKRLMLTRNLSIFDRNPASATRLEGLGAIAAESPAALARRCDVVMICVPRSADVREGIFGQNGLLEGLSPGKIIVDQTSGDPNATREMAGELEVRGVRMLDAPVSGGPQGAEAGTIAIMVGGPENDLKAVLPILEEISPNVTHCGAVGAGQVVKLINNTISTCNRLAMLEGVAMGIRSGIDPAVLQRVLNAGGARSNATETYLPKLINGSPRADFTLGLMLKDLKLAAELAIASSSPLPFGQLASAMLQAAEHMLGPNASVDDIADMVAEQTAIEGFRSRQ